MSDLLDAMDKIDKAKQLADGAFMAVHWMKAGMERDALATIIDVITDTLKSANQMLDALQKTTLQEKEETDGRL